MDKQNFLEVFDQILEDNPQFDREAYTLVLEALDFTIKLFKKPEQGPERHVTGPEMLDGVRQYALQEYGPLAQTTLAAFGITTCEDIGRIIFILVGKGLLRKNKTDSMQDYVDGYDFHDAFRKPFMPAAGAPATTDDHERPAANVERP